MKAETGGVARGALVSLIGQWAKYVVQIGAVVVFSRMLTPAEIGLVTAAVAVTGIAWVLSDFGLSLAGLQADELSQDQKSMLMWANTSIGAVITVIVCAISPLIAAFYDESRLIPVIMAGSACFLLSGLNAQFEVSINRAGRFGVLSAIGVTAQIVGLATGIVVIVLGGGYWGLVASPIAVSAVTLIGSVSCARWRPSRPRRGVEMSHLYRFGGQTLGLHLVTYIAYNADSVAIGKALGAAPLGLYNRAYQLSQVPALQLASPLTKVFLPALSRLRHDLSEYAALSRRIQLLLGYVLAGALSLLAIEAPAVIHLALGDGWDGAITALRVLCLASVLEMMGKLYYWLTLSHARAGLLFWVELGPRIVTVILILLWVDQGIVAVAWAIVVGQALTLLLGAVVVIPAVGLSRLMFAGMLLRPGLVIALASAAAAGVVELLPSEADLVVLIVGTLVWFGAVAVQTVLPVVRRDLGEILAALNAVRGRRTTTAVA